MPSADDSELADTSAAAPDPAEAPAEEPLYPGDHGSLPEPARRVLVQLLSGPFVDATRQPNQWAALRQHRRTIQSRLADLFLELVYDAEGGVAFLRQADTGELDAPILLRRAPLTFLESALLLFLRRRLAEADVRGERAVVDREEMAEQLRLFSRMESTDVAGFEKRINAAIQKVKGNSLLSAVRGSEGRFEISPTLKLLFSAEEVRVLAERYRGLLAEAEAEPEAASETRSGSNPQAATDAPR